MVLPTAAGTPTNLDAHQIGPSSFIIFWTRQATVTGYKVYWSGGGGADSGNMSVEAWSRSVSITGLTSGLTYNITLVALSNHLPSLAVAVIVYTLGETHKYIMTESIGCNHHTDVCHNPKFAYCNLSTCSWGGGGGGMREVRGTGPDFRRAPDLTVRP